jgi:hypothetical protein
MNEIKLYNKNKIHIATTYVSSEDYDNISKIKCCLASNKNKNENEKYVSCTINNKLELLHRYIYSFINPGILLDTNYVIDHINGNILDNRRENLRSATKSQNSQNIKKRITDKTTSNFKGIHKNSINKYEVKYNNTCLGTYTDEIVAARVYDKYIIHNINIDGVTNFEYSQEEKINIKNEEYIIPIKRKVSELPCGVNNTKNGKFEAYIKTNGKSKYLGTFNDSISAGKAYELAKEKKDKKNLELNNSLEITRNSEGIAVIKSSNSDNLILVNDDLWHVLNKYSWSTNNKGYYTAKINNKKYLMHRYILNAQITDKMIDHINRNKLDNRRENLRFVSFDINSHNVTKHKNCKCKYIGVTSVKFVRTRYHAYITHNRKRYNLGTFDTEKEAALAYNNKAIELYGEFANLNIIDDN